MTEPSPSPIPTTPSSQSWLDWISPLDNLWKDRPFVTFVITAVALPLAIWLGKRAWKTWKRKRHAQRVAARRQQLPSVRLPFTVEIGNQRLTLEPAQPQQNFAPEGMSIVRLLSARSTPVPFLDRAEALTRLETWARSEERFAIHVLGGDGGSGKTRLGVELCRHLTTPNTHGRGAEVWQAGFLQNIEQSDNTSSSDDASSLLIVVDYAEGQPEVVEKIINAALCAAEVPERQRVRIVFLVRRPSPLPTTRQGSNEWIDALRPQRTHEKGSKACQNEGLNRLLDSASTIILNDEQLSEMERKSLFVQAFTSFTDLAGSPPPSDLLKRLDDPMYSQPLLITVDAFLNARSQSRTQQSCSPAELFEEVLLHEENYWGFHWPSSLTVDTELDRQTGTVAIPPSVQDKKVKVLDRNLARQAVAAATLTDIQDEEDAINLLNLLPSDLGKNIKDLAKWLRDCYPPHMNGNGHPTSWCEHLEPDRIGEHLVVSEANNLVPLLRELLSPSRVGKSSLRTWTVLERASTDPRFKKHIGKMLNDMLVEVTQAVQDQATDSGNPDLTVGYTKFLTSILPQINPDITHEAEQKLPKGDHLTAFLGYELAKHATNTTKPTEQDPETTQATYASRQLSLGVRLAELASYDQALIHTKKAVAIYWHLAKVNPNFYVFSLISAMNYFAVRLADVNQHKDSLTIAKASVRVCRLAVRHNPVKHNALLAKSLTNLASRYAENNRTEKAVQYATEALNLYRSIVDTPSSPYISDLAMCLNDTANHLTRANQPHKALSLSLEACDIFSRLANREPSRFKPKLAQTQMNIAIQLTKIGQHDEALQIASQSADLFQELNRKSSKMFAANLAAALHNLTIHLIKSGKLEEASVIANRNVDALKSRYYNEPLLFGPYLYRALCVHADVLYVVGNTEEAAHVRQEGEDVLRRIEEMEEGNA